MEDQASKALPLNGVLGAGVTYKGELAYEGRLRIDGVFVGRIYSEELLEIGESGSVEGEVDVARMIISGKATGRIRVREHLLITECGTATGVLDIGQLKILPGGKINAEVCVSGEELA